MSQQVLGGKFFVKISNPSETRILKNIFNLKGTIFHEIFRLSLREFLIPLAKFLPKTYLDTR